MVSIRRSIPGFLILDVPETESIQKVVHLNMNWKEHIEVNESILAGKPIVKGTRLSVEHIINLFASGWTEQQILENYPRLSKESLQAVFGYIQEFIKDGLFYNEPLKSA